MTDIPNGAIHNGREHFRRLEDHYDFQCEGGPLSKCSDFDGAKRCFEVLAEHAYDPEREKKVEALVEAAEDAMIDLKNFWRRHYDESGFTRSPAQRMAESATTVRKLRHALHSLKGGENG